MIMLKRLTNLLFTLFSSSFPLYKQVYAIIKALREYSPNARAAVQNLTKTRIDLNYAPTDKEVCTGQVVGSQECLGEFTNMVNQLTAKKCGNISHI